MKKSVDPQGQGTPRPGGASRLSEAKVSKIYLPVSDNKVAVILSSGYSLDHQAAEIMKRGCRRFIQKPYSVGSLSRTIRDVLDGKEKKGSSG